MKKKKWFLDFWFVLFIVIDILFSIWATAELNYVAAIKAADKTEGTDLAIELKMAEYGFTVDAYNTSTPDFGEKLKALVKLKHETNSKVVKEGYPDNKN